MTKLTILTTLVLFWNLPLVRLLVGQTIREFNFLDGDLNSWPFLLDNSNDCVSHEFVNVNWSLCDHVDSDAVAGSRHS